MFNSPFIINYRLPSFVLLRKIGRPSSLRQFIVGAGEPVAAQRKVTFVPSRTTMSVLVRSSIMSGGTVTIHKRRI